MPLPSYVPEVINSSRAKDIICRVKTWLLQQKPKPQWVRSFLTAHRHIKGHFVPCLSRKHNKLLKWLLKPLAQRCYDCCSIYRHANTHVYVDQQGYGQLMSTRHQVRGRVVWSSSHSARGTYSGYGNSISGSGKSECRRWAPSVVHSGDADVIDIPVARDDNASSDDVMLTCCLRHWKRVNRRPAERSARSPARG